ncbi:MAG: hypothetical protein BKP49_06620 [Treponema sp. CETP13]|nr:MAG: hypothetical protein BKP49_06620 [Treponema sp. CETP13]
MYDFAKIDKIDSYGIKVTPIMTEHCMGCANHCELEAGKPFIVTNPDKIEVKEGQFVKIGANRKAQGKQAGLVILIPALFAVLGWFIVSWIAFLTGSIAGEGLHVLGVLLGALIPMLIIYASSRKKNPDSSYIEKVVDTSMNEIQNNACLTHL